jgi:phage terminase large subunit-like protein
LSAELSLWFKEFSQGSDRLVADKELRDSILHRRIVHAHEDGLTRHVTNANARTEGEHLRIVKRAEHLKIDACVALSMANSEARRLNL